MAINKTIPGLLFITTALLILMTGCATSVPISGVQAPTINTQGIQRMAVIPFTNTSGLGGSVAAQLIQYLSSKTQQEIASSGKFTMVAPADPNADGVFTGKITRIETKDKRESYQTKDEDGNEQTIIRYTREVFLEFNYSVFSTRTDMAIGTVMKSGSQKSSSDETPANLASTEALGKRIIDTQLSDFADDIVPRIVTTNINLINETSKDKVVKNKMKAVLSLVKAGSYDEAIRQYDEIADEYNSAAARTNAEYLRQSIASAAAAQSELTRLFQDKDGRAEKAIKGALAALNAKLPSGSTITILKQQSAERGMLDYVVDGMTRTLVQNGKLKVVDRANQALIHAEQQFQLTGAVSDESMVSIGRQLGVKYMVLCWISGEKSLRHLNLKVLNIETAQITDQSAFEI